MTATRYQAERDMLLQKITRQLESDGRVVAAWLFGSLGRGDADELSDIDLWVVVADEAVNAVVAARRQYVAQAGEPVLRLEAPQNAPRGGAYLMAAYDATTGPHVVDWYWQPHSSAFIPPQTHLIFDRIGLATSNKPIQFVGGGPDPALEAQPIHFISFFWMMWLITAKHVARDPHLETILLWPYLLGPFCRTQIYLGLPEDARGLSEDLPRVPSPHEKIDALRRLADEMTMLMNQISARGQAVPEAIVPGARRYLKLIEAMANTYQT